MILKTVDVLGSTTEGVLMHLIVIYAAQHVIIKEEFLMRAISQSTHHKENYLYMTKSANKNYLNVFTFPQIQRFTIMKF